MVRRLAIAILLALPLLALIGCEKRIREASAQRAPVVIGNVT